MGQGSERNSEEHKFHICHIVNLSLAPRLETLFKHITVKYG
jgi:hypothetical protein